MSRHDDIQRLNPRPLSVEDADEERQRPGAIAAVLLICIGIAIGMALITVMKTCGA